MLPEEHQPASPDDGITRIAIPKPYSDWATPVVFLAVVANIATGTFLRSRSFFQFATNYEQIAFAIACFLATSLPFVAGFGLWRVLRRRISRSVRPLDPNMTDVSASEQYFQSMNVTDAWNRSRGFTGWAQERKSESRVYVVHWHDEVAAVHPVKTPFEPRPIESDDSLPDAGESSDESAAIKVCPGGAPTDSSKKDGNKRSGRTMAIIGITMIAVAVLWVAAGLAQSPRIQWLAEMVLPLTVTVLAGITIWGLRGLLNRDRWLLVPGGVIFRRSRGARAGVENFLFDRRKSVACVLELTDANWLVTVQSGQTVAQRRVTPVQLQRFLRTWLSPIPPPVERLVDFE